MIGLLSDLSRKECNNRGLTPVSPVSCVDYEKRGGDIDLLIETDAVLPNRVDVLCKLEGRFAKVLGDQKIDVLIKDARTVTEAPIYRVAIEKGVPL